MTLRPDLVDAWIFRLVDGRPQVLMLRRSAVKVLSGLWQGVSGRVEGDESVVDAVLREVREETGIGPDAIEGLYSLDFVASFLWEPLDAVMSSVHFGIRVGPGIEPVLSEEHDRYRWLTIDEAIAASVWPAYREAITRVRDCLLDPAREPWFRIPPAKAAVD
jgi:8-oxo-dGTP pyrophosphatase MutT (NUDIX family)